MRIPIATLPEPQKDTTTRVGHVYAHETYIPVVETTTPEGVSLRLNEGHENLGELLPVSARLSLHDVKNLCEKKEVRIK